MQRRFILPAAALVAALALTGCVRLPSPRPVNDTDSAPTTTETVESPAAEEPAAPQLTMGQQQAIGKAEDYLRYQAFSRTGLIGQLEFEGFTTEDATFAVDSLAVDWNAQAAAKAEQYLDSMSFSREGLIDQLVFEGFTPEEAEYGVQAVGY